MMQEGPNAGLEGRDALFGPPAQSFDMALGLANARGPCGRDFARASALGTLGGG
jgi:hypothetical protein